MGEKVTVLDILKLDVKIAWMTYAMCPMMHSLEWLLYFRIAPKYGLVTERMSLCAYGGLVRVTSVNW